MVEEVLRVLRPVSSEVAVDCTLGGGGHARALLERVLPGGLVIGLDVDSVELPRTEARLRAMKMQNEIRAPRAGVVRTLGVREGASVEANGLLVRMD
jgi:16S rRNA (cytosine1402-N4)-methyltransferase